MNSKQFATVLVITFVVGMIWLAADIMFNTKASIPVSDTLQSTLEQVNPTFNGRVLEMIAAETLSTNEIQVTTPAPVTETNVDEIRPAPSSTQSASPAATAPTAAETVPSPSPQNPDITPIITISPSPSSTAATAIP